MLTRLVGRSFSTRLAASSLSRGGLASSLNRLGMARSSSTAALKLENPQLEIRPLIEPKLQEPVPGLQHTLHHVIRLVSAWGTAARCVGVPLAELQLANDWTLKASTSTVGHVTHSQLADLIREGLYLERELSVVVASQGCPTRAGVGPMEKPTQQDLSDMSISQLQAFGVALGMQADRNIQEHAVAAALSEWATQGLVGGCIFAARFGSDDRVLAKIHDIYHELEEEPETNCRKRLVSRVGKLNMDTLAQLDHHLVDAFGIPQPTSVPIYNRVSDKSILVSGHEINVLHDVLQKTAGTHVSVYTHGDLMAAHAFPVLRQFPNLEGHFECRDFEMFPGPIVTATDGVFYPPKSKKFANSDKNKIVVGSNKADLSKFIAKMKHMDSDESSDCATKPVFHTTGHHHVALQELVPVTAEAIQSGRLERILFLVGSCESNQDHAYYTALAQSAPPEAMILTAGSVNNGMFHSTKMNGNFPRHVDLGQLSNIYSGIVFLSQLGQELNANVPVSVAMTHSHQRDTAILLALLSQGIKNIRIGPSCPDNVTPKMMEILSDRYHVVPTGNPQDDLQAMMQGQ